MDVIRQEMHSTVCLLTMNRPEKMNAYNVALHTALHDAIDAADKNPDVRAIVVTGAGKAFCAGADISQGFTGAGLAEAPPKMHGISRDYGGMLALRIYECDTPIIAAINGVAVGIGATMTLPMDIKIMSQSARMGFPFTRRGIVFDAASSWFLPRIVGAATAQALTITGEIFDANSAHSYGLVTELAPIADVLPRAMEIAQDIAQNCAPGSVARNKQLLRASAINQYRYEDGPMGAHLAESAMLETAFTSADCLEGVRSFLEKRPPNFAPYDPEDGSSGT